MNEAARLERLWSGRFGREYVVRNRDATGGRRAFWEQIIDIAAVGSVLEVGCNVGGNLVWLTERLGAENVAGVDINEGAMRIARELMPEADLREASAYDLPFQTASFDLSLYHGCADPHPSGFRRRAMREVIRCSSRYVPCGEYFAEKLEEVPYRGQRGALFKQDYGRLYRELDSELSLVDSGFLPASEGGWDNVTWWLLEKR